MKSDYTKEEVVNMAQTVQDMEKKTHTKPTIFSRLKAADCGHLKPLSVYSRLITCDKKVSPNQFSNPFINFKIEVKNDCKGKRKLDHSSPVDGYETPKKRFCPKALSPDQGCFVDSSSPPARQDSESSLSMSKPALLSKTDDGRSEMMCGKPGHSEHVERGSSTELGDNKWTLPHSIKCEMVLLNTAPAFDCDVDGILCLNPFGMHNAGQSPDNVQSGKSSGSHTFQDDPVLIPTVAHGKKFQGGDGQVEEEREEMKKEMYADAKDVEEDKGYFSMSYIKDLKTGKDPSQSYPQLPPSISSPLLRIGEVGASECHPESSSELGCHKQVEVSGQYISFTADDFCPVVNGPLESANSPKEILDGDVEEVWDIGLPILESSLCHNVTVKLNGSEQSRQVSEEVQGGVLHSVQECRSTHGEEESTLDTSYETTLPLQVQVKSVVVRPSQHTHTSNKPAAPPLPDPSRPSQAAKCVSTARSQRPFIYHTEVGWEHDKRMYLHSVTKHMDENLGEGRDVMNELMTLMTHVADQTPGTNGRQWQHPSDLTRRNFQRRFGNMMPTMALHEWQTKNCLTYKRFAHIPKIFQRCQFP